MRLVGEREQSHELTFWGKSSHLCPEGIVCEWQWRLKAQ